MQGRGSPLLLPLLLLLLVMMKVLLMVWVRVGWRRMKVVMRMRGRGVV